MSIPHPGGDPNANLYAQRTHDVLDRIPHITTVDDVPDDITIRQLRATFSPECLDPTTGPGPPELVVTWYRQSPHDWFRVNYNDSNTGFHAGWHQDKEHPDLSRVQFQGSMPDEADRWGISFDHEIPSLIRLEILEELLENVLPTDQ